MSNAVLHLFRATLVVAFLASFASLATGQDSFSSLEERMTGKEFKQAGLHKLSEDELAALNAWIQARSLAEGDRKSTRLNSSHVAISYAVFCLKKKKEAAAKRDR